MGVALSSALSWRCSPVNFYRIRLPYGRASGPPGGDSLVTCGWSGYEALYREVDTTLVWDLCNRTNHTSRKEGATGAANRVTGRVPGRIGTPYARGYRISCMRWVNEP